MGPMNMKTILDVIVVLIPFVMLFSGFLLFHAGSLMTTLFTALVELVIVIVYYHVSPGMALVAAIWGTVVLWAPATLYWIGQLFGEAFNETGLMQILLHAFASLFPAKDKTARTIAPIALLSGFIGTFGGQAGYPVVVPVLTGLGYTGVQAGAATLAFASWLIPFSSFGLAAVICSAATHLPIERFISAEAWYGIPMCFLCTYATFDILGLSFFKRDSQIVYWITCLSSVLGLVLFTQVWPSYYGIPLLGGAICAAVAFSVYGRLRIRQAANEPEEDSAASGNVAAIESKLVEMPRETDVGAPALPTPAGRERPTRLSVSELIEIPHPHMTIKSGTTEPIPSWRLTLKALAPLVIAMLYVLLTYNPVFGHLLAAHLTWTVSVLGLSPVVINPLTTPAFPILIAALFCYPFRAVKDRPMMQAFGRDLAEANRHGISTMGTFSLSCSIMYLMSYSGQIKFLGDLMSSAGSFVYELFDATVIMAGGTIFGAGTPAIFIFSQMQIPAAAALGLPVILLLGLVVVGALGATNGMKPPNVRFVAALSHLGAEADNDIFRIGMKWVCIQAVLVTVLTFVYVPFWK